MSAIVSGSDFDSDGKIDILARERAYPSPLWLYPGNGDGTVGERIQVSGFWSYYPKFTAAGDLDHDGRADLLAFNQLDECLYVEFGVGNGTFDGNQEIVCFWFDPSAEATGIGDFDRDGHADWLTRRPSNGALSLCHGNGTDTENGYLACRYGTPVPGDWSSLTIA